MQKSIHIQPEDRSFDPSATEKLVRDHFPVKPGAGSRTYVVKADPNDTEPMTIAITREGVVIEGNVTPRTLRTLSTGLTALLNNLPYGRVVGGRKTFTKKDAPETIVKMLLK